ncbi:putative membrane protein [Ehrlichia ruminantium]|uniref:Putative membrane protein n=1 Tax=Ehrlichia ruminantium TaxID=779 RepID=A0A170RVF1_EHRRU|nr:hypothetical protein [Ehrlichia ruminantium]GAT75283.1 putative membrane protein [Ehrlichia ruminantium]GAT77274.1 putative membrane protein [Ehrlichia ruminantium]GAT78368.1 putative membrane protein [Ehrlichia ruminantium]
MKYFNKKLIVILLIIISLSSLYTGLWFVVATQVKATVSKAFHHVSATYGDIQIIGFPFTPYVSISDFKINASSINILAHSLSVKYSILNNELEFLTLDGELKIENKTKITKSDPINIASCRFNHGLKVLIQPSENLLFMLFKDKSTKKLYFKSIKYHDSGISCNNKSNIGKNSFFIESNESKALNDFITKLQYKINADIITDTGENTINATINNSIITLMMTDVDFKQVDADIEHIDLKFKNSSVNINGRLSIPLSLDNKVVDEGKLIIKMSNYQDAIRQLIELFYTKVTDKEQLSSILSKYIYDEISDIKDSNNITLLVHEKKDPFNVFIGKISYKDFINKIKSIINVDNHASDK